MMKFIYKLLEAFQDGDKLSSTRVINAGLGFGYIAQASWIVSQTNTIPDIPLQLAGVMVTLYGVNKLKGILGNAK